MRKLNCNNWLQLLQNAEILNSPQREWDCKRVCSNTKGVNYIVHWTHWDIWTTCIYTHTFIYLHLQEEKIFSKFLIQHSSMSMLRLRHERMQKIQSIYYLPPGGSISQWNSFHQELWNVLCHFLAHACFQFWHLAFSRYFLPAAQSNTWKKGIGIHNNIHGMIHVLSIWNHNLMFNLAQ